MITLIIAGMIARITQICLEQRIGDEPLTVDGLFWLFAMSIPADLVIVLLLTQAMSNG